VGHALAGGELRLTQHEPRPIGVAQHAAALLIAAVEGHHRETAGRRAGEGIGWFLRALWTPPRFALAARVQDADGFGEFRFADYQPGSVNSASPITSLVPSV